MKQKILSCSASESRTQSAVMNQLRYLYCVKNKGFVTVTEVVKLRPLIHEYMRAAINGRVSGFPHCSMCLNKALPKYMELSAKTNLLRYLKQILVVIFGHFYWFSLIGFGSQI